MTPWERARRADKMFDWWKALIRTERLAQCMLLAIVIVSTWQAGVTAMLLPWVAVQVGLVMLRRWVDSRVHHHLDRLEREDARRRP